MQANEADGGMLEIAESEQNGDSLCRAILRAMVMLLEKVLLKLDTPAIRSHRALGMTTAVFFCIMNTCEAGFHTFPDNATCPTMTH